MTVTAGSTVQVPSGDIPTDYLGAYLRAEDVGIFQGTQDKDVRRSLRVGRVAMPELAPDEVLVAVMASSVNYNTVWSAMFEPVPTFKFLGQFARTGGWAARHDLPYHVVGSDGAGVIAAVGPGVRRWQPGDHVVISPAYVDDQEPGTHADGMLGAEQRVWGFETNFGGLAEYAVARASQLIPKPAHLTWEEAACNPLCGGTAYRMLVSDAGARMRQGDVVLIWGAAGGLGSYAAQLTKNGGGIAVGVVSSAEKAEAARRLGCDVVINRAELGLTGSQADDPGEVLAAGRRLGAIIRKEAGADPRIVFDHVGQSTFGISTFVASRGGTVVTCGSSTGYQHCFDNRYLWMKLKRIVGSHVANLAEQWDFNELIARGRVMPAISAVFPLAEAPEAVRLVQANRHVGKVAVLCQATQQGLGVTDPALRAAIGERRLLPLHPEVTAHAVTDHLALPASAAGDPAGALAAVHEGAAWGLA
jgi:crotonyl-CoA reductase